MTSSCWWPQAFADIAALVLVQHHQTDAVELRERTNEALVGRTVIEQAKGVLAFRHGLAIDEAYTTLRDRAATSGSSLTAAAAEVVDQAAQYR